MFEVLLFHGVGRCAAAEIDAPLLPLQKPHRYTAGNGDEDPTSVANLCVYWEMAPAGRLQFECGMQSRPLNDISYLIIQAAIQVHRKLGPGLLESVYRACLKRELCKRQLAFVAESWYRSITTENFLTTRTG